MPDFNQNKSLLVYLADKYNNLTYFEEDPIRFVRYFYALFCDKKVGLQDVEIAACIASHLAWGRRSMIIRDAERAFAEMDYKPYQYILNGDYRHDDTSLHRTVMWSEFAAICTNLKNWYSHHESLECLTADEFRCKIFNQKSNHNAANKKIHLLRRWLVRNDGKVDIGIWKQTSAKDLIIPLDVHVHNTALSLGITSRKQTDYKTALEITNYLSKIFVGDPCLGDFALFGVGIDKNQ